MINKTFPSNLPENSMSNDIKPKLPHNLAPDYLPESMVDSVRLLPANKRLILFTRHSLRFRSDGNGFASSELALTNKGIVLAKAWGRWLTNNLAYSLDVPSISSPIQRCIDTAKLMQEGAGVNKEVTAQSLLVEPGSLVVDSIAAQKAFKEIGALNFINRFLDDDLTCTKNACQGGLDILTLLYENQPNTGSLALAVSHDTLLAAFLGVMLGLKNIDWNDWPKMMEGTFLWFDDKPFNEASVNLVWRGQVYVCSVQEIIHSYK